MKLGKELCAHLSQFQRDHQASESYIQRLNGIHESILQEQEFTLSSDPLDTWKLTQQQQQQQQSSSSIYGIHDQPPPPPMMMGVIDPNQEYKLHGTDFETLKRLYRDTSKQLEHEENLLVLIISKLQDVIDKQEEKKSKASSKAAAVSVMQQSSSSSISPTKTIEQQHLMQQQHHHHQQQQQQQQYMQQHQQQSQQQAAASRGGGHGRGKGIQQQQQQQMIAEKTVPPVMQAVKQAAVDQQQTTTAAASMAERAATAAAQQQAHRGSARAYITGDTLDIDSLTQGDSVAARVSLDSEDEDFWILARVLRYIGKDKIEVEDEDPGDEGQVKKRYRLAKKHIIPLPRDISDAKPFKKGTEVLAMFPNTTTFYRAIVDQPLTKSSPKDYYLKFEDDEDEETQKTPSRKVKFNYVIALPNR